MVQWLFRRPIAVAVGLLVAGFLLRDARAGFLFEDIPHLSSIAASEILAVGHLGTLVERTATMLKDIKEQTTLLKTAYHGIDDVIHLRWDKLRSDVMTGVEQAVPGLSDMYADIQDIADLNYTNAQARETLRGMLYEFAYGPAIDYLHQQHEDLDAVADAAEMDARLTAKVNASRAMLGNLDEQCDKGPGQCMGAAQRAAIEQGQILADIQEATLQGVELQRRMLVLEDQKATTKFYEHQRFTGDFAEHVLAVMGPSLERSGEGCRPGQCLYETFRNSPYEVNARFRRNHPPRRTVHSVLGPEVASGVKGIMKTPPAANTDLSAGGSNAAARSLTSNRGEGT